MIFIGCSLSPQASCDVPCVCVRWSGIHLLCGCCCRSYGMPAAQFKAYWDATGSLWQKGALAGKPVGVFFSTATQGGGQESTALTGALLPQPPLLSDDAEAVLCSRIQRPA